MSESIYPITQMYFQCGGCKAQWMIRPEPPIQNVEDFKAFTDRGGMGACPKGCGARTCSIAFRLPTDKPSTVDPFSVFEPPDPDEGT